MRIGVIFTQGVANRYYRAISPMAALERRGHEIVTVVQAPDGDFDYRPLFTCDVVHIYRRAGQLMLLCVDKLRSRRIGVTWDNDDDVMTLPHDSPSYRRLGSAGVKREFAAQVRMIRRVDAVTTTNDRLAAKWRAAGAREVVVVENWLDTPQHVPERPSRDSIVIGWVAGTEHYADATRLRIKDVLQRIQAREPRVRVASIGVHLGLDPAGYDYEAMCQFPELPARIRQFDIGIAPLADIPMSYVRSDIKVKEYAGAGVPWVASKRGPYAQLGRRHGGLTVADDEWEGALWALVSSSLKRRRLRRRAKAWAESQRIDLHAHRWEAVLQSAIASAEMESSARRSGVT